MTPARGRRRLLAPEVVQTSVTDCGPAALKCLLEGHGIRASYGRLREACQTSVDGTSIDSLEEVAGKLGLEVEQTMMPVDHLRWPEAEALPAIVVKRLPGGFTHFSVAWRLHRGVLQEMDPASGRRWPAVGRFLREVYEHTAQVPAAAWRAWAGSESALGPLRRRIGALQAADGLRPELEAALADPGWRSLAALDAAVRMTHSLVDAGGIRRGAEARSIAGDLFRAALASEDAIGPGYWSARAAPPADGEERVTLRGAVLLKVAGRREEAPAAAGEGAGPLEGELAAALAEPPPRPGRALLSFLKADGLLRPLVLAAAALAAAAGVALEALVLRGLLDLRGRLGPLEQRLGAIGAAVAFLAALAGLELLAGSAVRGLGRRLEARMRVAFLEKLPRLADRYLQSRSASDLAERSHTLHWLRAFPSAGWQGLRLFFGLCLTAGLIGWLDPASAPLVAAVVAGSLLLPLLAQVPLIEQELRLRVHSAGLGRFYLDALLGLVMLRSHGAERSARLEHESMLLEWARAGRAVLRTVVSLDALQAALGLGLSAWLLAAHVGRAGASGEALLLAYWALQLPALGQQLAALARAFPSQRNQSLRLAEILSAYEEPRPAQSPPSPSPSPGAGAPAGGAAIHLEGVAVRAGGQRILEGVTSTIEPGSQVAIVGPSGAGKSTLVGLLLGWHRPAEGVVYVDGEVLDGEALERLRRRTAWVDPAVQLWNRSLLDNLRYGVPEGPLDLGPLMAGADLRALVEGLPDGLRTPLGESGALVSGGEGQRVRLGRAMARGAARLVVLDEPFRGLDRERRRALLARARALWRGATLLCVTHDLAETAEFDRVLVVEGGRVVEDGPPAALGARDGGRYRALLEADRRARGEIWDRGEWRRLYLESGQLRAGGERGR